RRPPGELELIILELIELTLGFRDATPELLDVGFQTVALTGQLTEGAGQRLDGAGQFRRQSGLRRALTLADKPGHWPTLTSGRPVDRLPRRRSADRLGPAVLVRHCPSPLSESLASATADEPDT